MMKRTIEIINKKTGRIIETLRLTPRELATFEWNWLLSGDDKKYDWKIRQKKKLKKVS